LQENRGVTGDGGIVKDRERDPVTEGPIVAIIEA